MVRLRKSRHCDIKQITLLSSIGFYGWLESVTIHKKRERWRQLLDSHLLEVHLKTRRWLLIKGIINTWRAIADAEVTERRIETIESQIQQDEAMLEEVVKKQVAFVSNQELKERRLLRSNSRENLKEVPLSANTLARKSSRENLEDLAPTGTPIARSPSSKSGTPTSLVLPRSPSNRSQASPSNQELREKRILRSSSRENLKDVLLSANTLVRRSSREGNEDLAPPGTPVTRSPSGKSGIPGSLLLPRSPSSRSQQLSNLSGIVPQEIAKELESYIYAYNSLVRCFLRLKTKLFIFRKWSKWALPWRVFTAIRKVRQTWDVEVSRSGQRTASPNPRDRRPIWKPTGPIAQSQSPTRRSVSPPVVRNTDFCRIKSTGSSVGAGEGPARANGNGAERSTSPFTRAWVTGLRV
mmetsp:Transcript_18159/g.28160  ORF Transcript_18159/g.28160 Transcript_18159/m.28160 type:complete len:410 (-) Transcript_18159:82-1311(-)